VQDRPPRHIRGSCGIGQERETERHFRVTMGGGGGVGHTGGGCRCLTSGHTVVEVVDADNRQTDVAACRVDEMIAADGEEVAVTAENHYIQFGIGELHARGEGDGPAMGGVIGVQPDIPGGPARAANTRYHDRLLEIDPASPHGYQARGKSRADATPGAPDMRHTFSTEQLVQRVCRMRLSP